MITLVLGMLFATSLMSIAIATWALIEVRSMKQSTHQVQYIPVENPDATTGKDLLKKLHPELADGEDYS